MPSRRDFIKYSTVLVAGLKSQKLMALGNSVSGNFVPKRPIPGERKFRSNVIDEKIREVKSYIKDKELAWMFENCFPNTLDTTIDFEMIEGNHDTFVITGDIDAMWLRDSTAQVWPYMPFINEDEHLKNMIRGLIRRQTQNILLDPYANAFYKDPSKISRWISDKPKIKPGVHERKWEIDSLCYPIRLANEYYRITNDASIFTRSWNEAARLVYNTFKIEQRMNGMSPYWFERKTTAMIDAPPFRGTGRPIKPVGLICSMFRPSDDSTLFPFLIPSNLFAAQSLRQLSVLYKHELRDEQFADECTNLADQIKSAVKKYAIHQHLNYGNIYAYEVDGFGNKLFMDDANVPSLMSLAYLNICKSNDPVYLNTRKFLLSNDNPYFLKGKAAKGQGSPHTGKENIWPMGIILRALTSNDESEIAMCISMLKATHAGTGFMHESFHKDDARNYSRDWFAWANTLFGELILKLYSDNKTLLVKKRF